MNASLKLYLFKSKKYSDGTHPVVIHYNIGGKRKLKVIHKCKEIDWDAKNNKVKSKVVNSAHINNFLSEEYAKAERMLFKIRQGEATVNEVFEDKNIITLDYALGQELERFKAEKKTGAYKRFEGYKLQLLEHYNSAHTDITSVNIKWFEKLARFFSDELVIGGKVVKKANSNNVVQVKIKVIRRVIAKYSGITPSDDVQQFRVKTTKPIKQKLSSTELDRIEALQLTPGSLEDVVRDIFFLQIYLRGARIGSILQAYSEQFDNGRYVAVNAGGKNNVGAKLIPKAQAIVDKYYGKHERLFPIYKWQPDPKAGEFENKRRSIKKKEASTAIVNKVLKVLAEKAEINKPLSSHIARHTYARMAIDKINNPMITMELLGHSDLKVHQGYLNDIRKDDELDKANDDIFG